MSVRMTIGLLAAADIVVVGWLELRARAAGERAGDSVIVVDVDDAGRLDFPQDLPDTFTASSFPSALKRLLAECHSDYDLIEEDCSEFPCIAFGTSHKHNHGLYFSGCDIWDRTIGSNVSMYSREIDGQQYVSVIALPSAYQLSHAALYRVSSRATLLLDAIEGRKITIQGGTIDKL